MITAGCGVLASLVEMLLLDDVDFYSINGNGYVDLRFTLKCKGSCPVVR
jgi:hypothetical protein